MIKKEGIKKEKTESEQAPEDKSSFGFQQNRLKAACEGIVLLGTLM